MTNHVCRNRMPQRKRSATPIEGGEDRVALENMAATIKEQVTLTNRMRQHLEENGG